MSININHTVKQRLSDLRTGKVEAKTEKELDRYLKKRGIIWY